MRALHTTLALETGTAWTPATVVKTRRPAARARAAAKPAQWRNVALFLMAPFVGLLYAVLLPFVGLGMLAWMGARTFVETGRWAATLRAARKLVLLAAAPFLALGYVVAMPFIGLGALAWCGLKAAVPKRTR